MSLAFLLFAALAAPPSTAAANSPAADLAPAPPSVLFDDGEDGAIWALGTNYKMHFDAHGATYFPLFGERATRHTPLSFDVAAPITAPIARDGNRVSIVRGGLVEVYDLAPDHVEQSFVLAARPMGGDFSLRLNIATDLPVARGAGGLRFDAGDLGRVEYGDATIVDATGRSISQRSEWDGGGVRFTLPKSFLSTARFPVVIDPLLTTFNVDASALACTAPSVAFEAEFDMFLVVFERAANAVDRDIISRRYAANAVFQDEVAIDITTKDTREPSVAASFGRFFTVWTDRNNPGTGDDIRGRGRDPSNTTQNAAYDVAATNVDEHAPDIGGTNAGGTNAFLVVWQLDNLGNSDIAGRTCSSSAVGSAITNYTAAKTTTLEVAPHVSPAVGTSSDPWFVVWSSGPNAAGTGDIDFLAVNSSGAALGAITSASGITTEDDRAPDIAGNEAGIAGGPPGPRDFVVVWERISASGDSNIFGRGIRQSGGVISLLGPAIDLSAGELVNSTAADQHDPAVDFDGVRYIYSYIENDDVFACACHVDSNALFFEKHVAMTATATVEKDANLAAGRFAAAGNHLIAWQTVSSPTNIDAAIYSSRGPGGITVIDNGCGGGGFEPLFIALGPGDTLGPSQAVVGQQLVFGVLATHAPILVIGPAANIPLCPNQGGCTLRASPQILLPFTPSFPFIGLPVPSDPALIGFAVSMQLIDVLPAASAGPKCGPPKYNGEFRTSDTMSIVFQ